MSVENLDRVLIHAPYGRDAELISRVLGWVSISSGICLGISDLIREMQFGMGAVIVADDALRAGSIEELRRALDEQETWSDLPIIVLTASGESNAATRYRLQLLSPLGNVALLERPLRTETAISAVRTALRARRHQYRVRDLLRAERIVSDALSESEEHLRYTVELNPQVPWTADSSGCLESFSPRWLHLTGLRREEALAGGWALVTHPDDQPAAFAAWRHSVETGCPYDVEHRVRLADGSFRWMRTRAQPRRDSAARIVRWYGTTEDVHEEKLAAEKLRESNAELRAANRELEEFAFISSHDLQEPLRMINVYTQLLVRKLDPQLDDTTRQYAAFIRNGVRRMEGLLHDLLSFSRLIHSPPPVGNKADLSAALQDALATLAPAIDELQAQISYNGLPAVWGDQGQLSQLFQNLLSNALKYRKAGEQLQVEIKAKPDPSGWVISVSDNGIGFEQKHAEQIFGLFKRLFRDEYPGTGVGLAICKRIVERNGGHIWAESKPGKGSTFFFTVMRADENQAD